MYKQIKPPFEGVESNCIKRISDNVFIPFDPSNTDYQEYLKWVELGNVAEPAEEQ